MNSETNPILCGTGPNNEKIIEFNLDYLNQSESTLSDLITSLSVSFKTEKLDTGRLRPIIMSKNELQQFEKWILHCDSLIGKNVNNAINFKNAEEILRALRNFVSNVDAQNLILDNISVLKSICKLFNTLLKVNSNCLCLKILLQFLLNFISSNQVGTREVFDLCFDKIKHCLKNNINIYECSALLYNISLFQDIFDLDTVHVILKLSCSDHNEFLYFFLENLILSNTFWTIYVKLPSSDKITALQFLKNVQLNKKDHNLPDTCITVLKNTFLESADVIFQIKKGTDLQIQEISLILEVLSSMTSNEIYLKKFQDKNLLINTGVLLINIHRLGKASDNCFTPVQRLSEFESNKTELSEDPAFGFKSDLVRLIGNLCWKNITMQNLARTAELIPVILECCNMDARNPFIMQWAIFAVRNLCENNKENQTFIAGLHREGAVSSEVLEEMGLTLHTEENNQLKIVPLDVFAKLP